MERGSHSTPSEVVTIGTSGTLPFFAHFSLLTNNVVFGIDIETRNRRPETLLPSNSHPQTAGHRHLPTHRTAFHRKSQMPLGSPTSSSFPNINIQSSQISSQCNQNWPFFCSVSATQSHSPSVSPPPTITTATPRPRSHLEPSGASAGSRSTPTSDLRGTSTTSPGTNQRGVRPTSHAHPPHRSPLLPVIIFIATVHLSHVW